MLPRVGFEHALSEEGSAFFELDDTAFILAAAEIVGDTHHHHDAAHSREEVTKEERHGEREDRQNKRPWEGFRERRRSVDVTWKSESGQKTAKMPARTG